MLPLFAFLFLLFILIQYFPAQLTLLCLLPMGFAFVVFCVAWACGGSTLYSRISQRTAPPTRKAKIAAPKLHPTLRCVVCGKPLEVDGPSALFCSLECADAESLSA